MPRTTSQQLITEIESPGVGVMFAKKKQDLANRPSTIREAFEQAKDTALTPFAMMAADARRSGTKLSDEDKSELKREVTRGNKGEDKEYKKGGSVSSASKRADGIAQRGKTRGKIC
jgi:hypothetical protein